MKRIVFQGDTLACLKFTEIKNLNRQLSLLSAYKLTCDYTIQRSDSIIADYKRSQAQMRELLANKDLELSNNQTEIVNLKTINKKTRKKWIKNMLYGIGGGGVAGLLMGVLIAK